MAERCKKSDADFRGRAVRLVRGDPQDGRAYGPRPWHAARSGSAARSRPAASGGIAHTPSATARTPTARPHHGAPANTRHRIPSMSCSFVHFGGRPGFRPDGSNGSGTAHCASVRSARLLTVKVATRSPCRWSSWSLTHLPETSPIPCQRHAANSRSPQAAPPTFETRPK